MPLRRGLLRRAVHQGQVIPLPERKRMALLLNANGLNSSRALVGHGNTPAARSKPNRRAGQTRASSAHGILFRRGNGRGTVAALHHGKPRESEKDTGGEAKHKSSQTYSPLKIFLERATRNKSASLSASERASLRPAEVNR